MRFEANDFSERSTHIVVGKVIGVTSFWSEDRSTIYSEATLALSRILKGVVNSEFIVVRYFGGEVGEYSIRALGQPSFEVGEELKVYLSHIDGNKFWIVPFSAKTVVNLNASRTPPAANPSSNSTPGAGIDSGFGDPLTGAQSMGYDNLLGRRWSSAGFSYKINELGTPDTTGEFTAIQNAFQTWEDDPGSQIDFTYLGTTPEPPDLFNPNNVMGWVIINCNPQPCLAPPAQTLRQVIPGTNILIQADIQFNDGYEWTTTGQTNRYDVQNVATHEAGHTLELNDLGDETHVQDWDQTMFFQADFGETKKRTLEWGDIAGVRYIYPNSPTNTGWFGDETEESDVAVVDVDKNGVLDMVVLWIDDASGGNTIWYRIGWNINTNGNVGSWLTGQKQVATGQWVGDITSGAGVFLTDLNANGSLDMIALWIDSPVGADVMYYRIGWDMNTVGDVVSWSALKTIGSISDIVAGGGLTFTNLDSNIRPEMVVTWIDDTSGSNSMYYKVGWNVDTAGNPISWSATKNGPSSIGPYSAGAGIAAAVWLTDEFSETISRQWTTQAGTWGLETGELSGSGTSSKIMSSKIFPSDRTVQVRMKTITGGPSSWYTAWVAGKYDSETDRSVLVLHTTGTLEFNVAFTGLGVTTWTVPTGLSPYSWHTAKLVYTGTNAKVYVDNTLYFDVNDPKFSFLADGKVQLASWGTSHSHFEDVMIDDSVGRPDLVFSWADDQSADNFLYYRVGWDADASGNIAQWTVRRSAPGSGIGWYTQGSGVATGDVNGNGLLEMVFVWIDNPSGANKAVYRVEWESRVDSHI